MSVSSMRALRRTPLMSAILAIAFCVGGVAATQLATDEAAPPSLRFAKVIDTAHANAPPARALGLTAAYFETLGIGGRAAPDEKPAPQPAAECESLPASRFARRAAPAPAPRPEDRPHSGASPAAHELTSAMRSPITFAYPSE